MTRWFQFSLRTLLVATTIAAVAASTWPSVALQYKIHTLRQELQTLRQRHKPSCAPSWHVDEARIREIEATLVAKSKASSW